MKPSSSNDKLDGFQQWLRNSTTKENPRIAAAKSSSPDNRGRSLSSARVSTTSSRPSSQLRNHEEMFHARGRSHSTYRKKQQILPAEDKPSSTTRSRSKSQNRSPRASSKHWSSSAAYRPNTKGAVRTLSCRSKSEVRTRKSVADVTGSRSDNRVEDTLRRSRSMSRNRTAASLQGSLTAALSNLYSPSEGKSSTFPRGECTAPGSNGMAKEMPQQGSTRAPSSSRRFIVEVDEDMNILNLKEVNDDSQPNVTYEPLLTSEQYRQCRLRSSSLQPTWDEYRKSRRRSSSCEPPLNRLNASFTSRRRSGLNTSVHAFSIHNESTDDTIKRVNSYTRQVPYIVKDSIDFDPRLKESSSAHDSQPNVTYEPLLTSEQYRQSRLRSSSLQPTWDEYRKSRRRSSSCEPPLNRPNASFTSRSRPGLNPSVHAFSIHNESTDDTIKRVNSYSRQVPYIVKDSIDFDPRLKESSSTQETSPINDVEEDSLGFLQPATCWGMPSESEDADYTYLQSDFDSNLAIVAGVGEYDPNASRPTFSRSFLPHMQEKNNRSNHQLKPPMKTNTSTKGGFFRKKSCRLTGSGPVNKHSQGSEREEKEPSVLMTGAASSLEAQQQKTKWKRLYKMMNR
jgi:hypothetical protein